MKIIHFSACFSSCPGRDADRLIILEILVKKGESSKMRNGDISGTLKGETIPFSTFELRFEEVGTAARR
jgi:hypothetical protein